MKRILKEPLLHFLLLGALLFLAYGLRSKSDGAGSQGHIVVTVGQIEHLEAGFATTWQRPPTDAELKSLIDDWVHEEIATREAMALGLDRDDTVIRRRLRQKLEFVANDITPQAEPTDADLNAYLRAHPETFRVEPQFTFSQVYLDPLKHGDHLARDLAQMLALLRQAGAKADIAALGDSHLLEQKFKVASASEVARQFGDEFAASLPTVGLGQWQGPVASSYGVHLVLVSGRVAGRLPALTEVRDAVLRDWSSAQRLAANQKFYQDLLRRYTVIVERPTPAAVRLAVGKAP